MWNRFAAPRLGHGSRDLDQLSPEQRERIRRGGILAVIVAILIGGDLLSMPILGVNPLYLGLLTFGFVAFVFAGFALNARGHVNAAGMVVIVAFLIINYTVAYLNIRQFGLTYFILGTVDVTTEIIVVAIAVLGRRWQLFAVGLCYLVMSASLALAFPLSPTFLQQTAAYSHIPGNYWREIFAAFNRPATLLLVTPLIMVLYRWNLDRAFRDRDQTQQYNHFLDLALTQMRSLVQYSNAVWQAMSKGTEWPTPPEVRTDLPAAYVATIRQLMAVPFFLQHEQQRVQRAQQQELQWRQNQEFYAQLFMAMTNYYDRYISQLSSQVPPDYGLTEFALYWRQTHQGKELPFIVQDAFVVMATAIRAEIAVQTGAPIGTRFSPSTLGQPHRPSQTPTPEWGPNSGAIGSQNPFDHFTQ